MNLQAPKILQIPGADTPFPCVLLQERSCTRKGAKGEKMSNHMEH